MDVNSQTENTEVQQAQNREAAPQIANLDGYSEFEVQGSKYTPDQLYKILNEHKQFSETAKQRSEREEFDQHFEVDRARLLKDPSLADQFRQKYPKEYHWVLDFLPKEQRQETGQPNAAQTSLPPEVLEKIQKMEQRLSFYDQRTHQAEVQNAIAQIDKVTGPLFEKFPMADDEAVFAKADALLSQGVKLADKTWERIIRESHEKAQKKWDQHQGATLKQQLEKGRKAADVGPGGATPGQAPKRMTMDEAREAMLKSVTG
jgi:hypothetical protein